MNSVSSARSVVSRVQSAAVPSMTWMAVTKKSAFTSGLSVIYTKSNFALRMHLLIGNEFQWRSLYLGLNLPV